MCVRWRRIFLVGVTAASLLAGCARTSTRLMIKDISKAFSAGTIISASTGAPVTFESLLKDLSRARVIYVGEQHTSAAHHQIQLRIIETLYNMKGNLSVGMEMFDRTYQNVLDQWSQGLMEQKVFMQKVHWYANWRYDFDLYSDTLEFIKTKRIRLVGLNIPPNIPPKIRIGGIESLSDREKAQLPEDIDTTNSDHRTYLEQVFEMHHGKVRDNFEYFYQAQCVWEDIMAESVARHLKNDTMVVLAGNGHIIRKFGIPDRAFKRTQVPFRTIYLAPVGGTAERNYADYIWTTP